MLLRGLSEPNDPREQAIHRNLRALVETTAVQQAKCSVSRRRLATSLPVRGTGTQQMGHYTLSPQQPLSATHEGKRQDQDEGPSMQRGKKNRKDRRQPANFTSVAMADHTGT